MYTKENIPNARIGLLNSAMTWIKNGAVPESKTFIGLWNLDHIAFEGQVPSIGIQQFGTH